MAAPDGVEWRVGRRWLTRRTRFGRPRRGDIAAGAVDNTGPGVSDLGSLDFGEGLLVIAAVVAVALIAIPILLFGVELIIVGVLLAAGVVARTVLGQPWVVEARSTDPLTSGRSLEWRVRGWRKSGQLIREVVSDLSAGREPPTVELPQ